MKSVALDLDSVLAEYHGWEGHDNIGEPINGAVDFTHELKRLEYYIIIHTTRVSTFAVENSGKFIEELYDFVENWLKANDFKFDEIYIGKGKPVAVAYVDDKAITFNPMLTDTVTFADILLEIEALTELSQKLDNYE